MKKNILRSLSAIIAAAMLLCGALPALAEDKKETVFVMADANGHTDHIVVSERLYNPEGADTIEDVSTLENIENVDGDETFVLGEGGALVWNANGADISYEGTTDKPLPVGVRITYRLDGQEIAPADLAGKSGHLDMELAYSSSLTAETNVAGEKTDMAVPFLMATVMILDDDVYDNVEITNGKVIDAGNLKAALCYGMPGVREALNLDAYEKIDLELPETATISADVTDYHTSGAYTLATNSVFNLKKNEISLIDEDIDLDAVSGELSDAVDQLLDGIDKLYDGTGDLEKGAGDLNDGASDLKDGTAQLKNGAGRLKDGASDLKDGTTQLKDGASDLKDGLGEIDGNSEALADGAKQIFEGILATANEGLKEKEADFNEYGIELNELTIDNYAEELERLEAELLEAVEVEVYKEADALVASKVKSAVKKEVTSRVYSGAKKKVKNAVTEVAVAQVTEKVQEGADNLVRQKVTEGAREKVRLQVEAAVAQQVRAAVEAEARNKVEAAVRNPDEATVSAKVSEKLNSADVQAQIDAETASRMGSDEVKAAIESKMDEAARAQVEAKRDAIRSAVADAVRGTLSDITDEAGNVVTTVDQQMASDEVQSQINTATERKINEQVAANREAARADVTAGMQAYVRDQVTAAARDRIVAAAASLSDDEVQALVDQQMASDAVKDRKSVV